MRGPRHLLIAACLPLALGACTVDEKTGERVGQGILIGAAGGAAAGLITGDFGEGLLAGMAAGAAGGFVADQIDKSAN